MPLQTPPHHRTGYACEIRQHDLADKTKGKAGSVNHDNRFGKLVPSLTQVISIARHVIILSWIRASEKRAPVCTQDLCTGVRPAELFPAESWSCCDNRRQRPTWANHRALLAEERTQDHIQITRWNSPYDFSYLKFRNNKMKLSSLEAETQALTLEGNGGCEKHKIWWHQELGEDTPPGWPE